MPTRPLYPKAVANLRRPARVALPSTGCAAPLVLHHCQHAQLNQIVSQILFLNTSIMSQDNAMSPGQPYHTGRNAQNDAWYHTHGPHSRMKMSTFKDGFNLSETDFERLQKDIALKPPPEVQSMKSRQGIQAWEVWALAFYQELFEDQHQPRMDWRIKALPWLKIKCLNTAKRKERNEFTTPVMVNPQPRRIIWVAATPIDPETPPSEIEKNLVIKFYKPTKDLHQGSMTPWFNSTDLKRFESALGPAFVQSIGPTEQPDIHQGVVLLQVLKYQCDVEVLVYTWKDFHRDFVDKTELETMRLLLLDRFLDTTVLLYCDATLSLQTGMDNLYVRLEKLRSCFGARIRAIPSWPEVLRARGKIVDIQALDQQARKRNTWRPVTCYLGGVCVLADHDETVHKRQESSGGEHVQVKRRDENNYLTCSMGSFIRKRKSARGEKSAEATPLWFHQEYVPTFKKWGEFRVLMVMKPNNKVKGGLQPTILTITNTINCDDDKEDRMYTESVTETTLEKMNCGLSLTQLTAFSKHVVQDLLELSEETFESLKVGVRLDVAISPGRGGFFVNEVVRWYNAAFFSDTIADPKSMLCEEVGKSFARKYVEESSTQ